LQYAEGKVYNRQMLRFLSGCVIILALAAVTPQDSLDLRARYGEPDLERFAIRPDVTMTAQYGKNGKASELSIELRQQFLRQSFTSGPTMEQEAAMNLLNEVLPETRGKYKGPKAGMQDGCAAIGFMFYKNISVSVGLDPCVSPNRVRSVGVRPKLPTATLPYTSAELHARYGSADVEQFRVRQDIELTAEYGPDGQACAMRIQSVHDLAYPLDAPAAPVAEVLSALDEIVPRQARGKELGFGAQMWGACEGVALPTEYENVTISSPDWMCDPHSKVRAVDVHFKRPACEAFQPRRLLESQ
jgi:hypothetical protein